MSFSAATTLLEPANDVLPPVQVALAFLPKAGRFTTHRARKQYQIHQQEWAGQAKGWSARSSLAALVLSSAAIRPARRTP